MQLLCLRAFQSDIIVADIFSVQLYFRVHGLSLLLVMYQIYLANFVGVGNYLGDHNHRSNKFLLWRR